MLSRYPGPWFAPLRLRDEGWWGPLHEVGLKDTYVPSLRFLRVPTNTSQLKGDNFNSDYLFHFHAKSFRYDRDYLARDFIIKTYHLVDDPNTDKGISWLDHGQTFVVRCQMEFSRDVLPRYMNMEGFSRFVFTLSAYGFVFRVRGYEHIEFAMHGFENREGHYWKKGFKYSLDLCPVVEGRISSREKLREDPIQKLLPDTSFQEFMLKEGLLKVSAFRRRPHVPLFLVKTYVMVDDPASDNIVSWGPTGKSFVVWNAQKLYTDLLPAYFKHGDFAKFVLELCAFGFRFRSLKDTVRFEFAKRNFCRGQRQQPLQLIQSPLQDLSSAALRIEKGVAEMGRMYEMDMRAQAPLQTPANAGSKSYKPRLKPLKCAFKLRKCCGKPIRRRPETPLSQDSKIEDDITELRLLMKGIEKVLKRMKEKDRLRLRQTPATQDSKAGHDITELKEGVREVMKGMEEVMKGMEEMSLTRNMLLD